jgi:predicted enzyme related to lactoylglutathione lyase
MKNEKLSIGQVARNVKSVEESAQWYRQVLGLEHLYSFAQMVFFACQSVRLMLSQSDGDLNHESISYFNTHDIQSEFERLQKHGIKFSREPHKIHQHEDGSEEWMAFFTDLEGRPLGLMCAYRRN